MVKKSDFNILIVLILFICSSFIPLSLSYNSVPLKMDYNVSNTPSIKPMDIVYLKKDFDSKAYRLLYDNLNTGMIENFLMSEINLSYIVENRGLCE